VVGYGAVRLRLASYSPIEEQLSYVLRTSGFALPKLGELHVTDFRSESRPGHTRSERTAILASAMVLFAGIDFSLTARVSLDSK
jgi:hypothetical protein